MEAKILVGIIVAAFILFGTLIGFLSKWIVKSVGKANEVMVKDVILNKCDIIAIDDTLDTVLKDTEYTDKKLKKKNEIVKIYQVKGLLD